MKNTNLQKFGFTLIEVMIVVVILSILAAFIVPKLINRPDDAKMVKAQQDILSIESALELYKLDNGFYPTTEQSLEALITKPTIEPIPEFWHKGGYLKRLRMDPWNRPYKYLNPGNHGEIDIFSYGIDGKEGGTSLNADIGNWVIK